VALDNPKHERFAQELAKGKTADEAYVLAGYKQNRGNAATLKANQSVLDRVAQIQERAAIRTEVTVATITQRLLAIATKAEGKDEAPMLSVARASLMDAAKLNGLVVDKSMKAEASLEELLDSIDGAASGAPASSH
jgi:phage terminase small subunit